MIHVVRKNETMKDVGLLYDVEENEIGNANFSGEFIPISENDALWIPSDNRFYFPKMEESIQEIGHFYKAEPVLLKELNGTAADTVPANARVKLPPADKMKFELSSMHKVTSSETSFVPVDLYGKYITQIYIDGYDLIGNDLNLPYDYPAIQASVINKIAPRFVLGELDRYSPDAILGQLNHDLSFKEYDGGLLIVSTESEIEDMLKITRNLIDEQFHVSVAAPFKVLKEIRNYMPLFKAVYYTADKNIFDFESFTENISKLKEMVSSDKIGIVYKRSIADINKNELTINYIGAAELESIIRSQKEPHITFDENSQLCFLTYYDDGTQHNLVYEDVRSFYSKASYLLKEKINKIIIHQTDKDLIKYYGILKELSI